MEKYGFTELTEDAVSYAAFWANKRRMEFITPELVLVGVTVQMRFAALARMAMFDEKALRQELQEYNDKIDVIPEGEDYTLEISLQTHQVFEEAQKSAEFSGHSKINVPHLIRGILMLHESMATFLLHKYFGDDDARILALFADAYGDSGHGVADGNVDDGKVMMIMTIG